MAWVCERVQSTFTYIHRRRRRRHMSYMQQNKFLSPSAEMLYDAAGHYTNMRIFIWFHVSSPPSLELLPPSSSSSSSSSCLTYFTFSVLVAICLPFLPLLLLLFDIVFLYFIMMWLDFATFHSDLFGWVQFDFVPYRSRFQFTCIFFFIWNLNSGCFTRIKCGVCVRIFFSFLDACLTHFFWQRYFDIQRNWLRERTHFTEIWWKVGIVGRCCCCCCFCRWLAEDWFYIRCYGQN